MSEPKNAEALKDTSRVPLGERQAWSPAQAAQVYSLDYEGVRLAINNGDLDHIPPAEPLRKPGRRRVTKVRYGFAGSAAWRNNP